MEKEPVKLTIAEKLWMINHHEKSPKNLQPKIDNIQEMVTESLKNLFYRFFRNPSVLLLVDFSKKKICSLEGERPLICHRSDLEVCG